jgi:hypothetical protein
MMENWLSPYNTADMLRASALALWDIAPFGRNVIYADNVICDWPGGENGKF